MLDPLEITKALRLPPDHQHRDGEPRLVRTKKGKVQEYAAYRGGQWSMSSEQWVDSTCLATHLDWLLQQLEPHANAIRSILSGDVTADLFCYSLGSTTQPPSYPRSIADRAKSLGVSIEIDHYRDNDVMEPV